MEHHLKLETTVRKGQGGQYLTLSFEMPPDTETFRLSYQYPRHQGEERPFESGNFRSRAEVNIIDLGLIAPDGSQAGASGSDKTAIEISETHATPGYQARALTPGRWQILVGAYKVAPEGVTIKYELTFTLKRRRLFKGDLHTHTIASDGVHSAEELGQRATRHGLDFLAITDHNQMSTTESLPKIPGVTFIPGVEWTHFRGHANFLGVDRPYEGPFYSNDFKGVQDRFQSARASGALITINHPYEEICPFQFDLNQLPFDCLEVWNGPMRVSNLQALGLWQQLLSEGKKIPLCGGSDYHRDGLFIFPGGPTTCVWALSPSPADLLDAVREGHAYLTFAPNGPGLEMQAGGAMMGDSVPYPKVREVAISATGLRTGDVVQVVTAESSLPFFKAEANGDFHGTYKVEKPGFVRVEIHRSFVPGLPQLPALISNPIYFEEG